MIIITLCAEANGSAGCARAADPDGRDVLGSVVVGIVATASDWGASAGANAAAIAEV